MKRLLSFVIILLLWPLILAAQGSMKMNGRPVDVAQWITRHFGRGKTPPFSFLYGGKPSARIIGKWKHTLVKQPATDDCQLKYLATYTDPVTGLRVECDVTGWTDYAVVEWVLRFENTGSANTLQIKSGSRDTEKMIFISMLRLEHLILHRKLLTR